MTLEAGTLRFTLLYGQSLKDRDWFGKQDPYAIIQCGNTKVRSRTAVDGGKSPVWHETFSFNILNENNVDVTLMDEDTLKSDDLIGKCTISLARVREQGKDQQQVPVLFPPKNKQYGHISVSMEFQPNSALKNSHAQQPAGYAYPYAPAPAGYAPPQYAPSPSYAAPPPYGAAPPYGAPPQAYGAPQPYGQMPPAYSFAQPPAPAPLAYGYDRMATAPASYYQQYPAYAPPAAQPPPQYYPPVPQQQPPQPCYSMHHH